MKVEIKRYELPGYAIREKVRPLIGKTYFLAEGFEMELSDSCVKEYVRACEVYLEALAAFRKAMDAAQETEAKAVEAPRVE